MIGLDIIPKITKAQADDVAKRILMAWVKKSNIVIKAVSGAIKDLPEVKKLLEFMNTSRFRADIGIDPAQKADMVRDIKGVFDGERTEFTYNNKELIFGFVPEDALRETTFAIWTNVNNNRLILVNAWDIYEYGIVGDKATKGVIESFVKIKASGAIEKLRSRSKLALMRKKKGRRFIFGKDGAPQMGAIRSAIRTNTKNIRDLVAKVLTDGV